MRIAFLVNRFPALSETFILNQLIGLLDKGHHLDIFAKSGRDEPPHPDVDAYGLLTRVRYWPRLPTRNGLRWMKGLALLGREAVRRPWVALRAANLSAYGREALTMNLAYDACTFVEARQYDVIHCHFGDVGIRGMALRDMGLLKGSLITSFHGFDLSRYVSGRGAPEYRRLFHSGDFFLPVSERWCQRLLELGCPPHKLAVHYMGIDCARFGFHPRHPPADGIIRLLSIARLVEKKGIEYSIRAVANVTSRRKVAYTVVGDGPLRKPLEKLVRDLRLADVVQLVGPKDQPEVQRLLRDAHLLLVPSVVASDGDEEGIPVVLMEAMAMGLPVIATRHSGIPELVEDGVSGKLVPERDVAALAQAVNDLADRPDRWPALGAAGRQRVETQHNVHVLVDSLVSLYQRVVQSR